MLCLATAPKLSTGGKLSRCRRVELITVPVRGRLEGPLRVVVTVRVLLLDTLLIVTRRMLNPFRARALAPLKVTTPTLPVCLTELWPCIKTLPWVVSLAEPVTIKGTVRLRVRG